MSWIELDRSHATSRGRVGCGGGCSVRKLMPIAQTTGFIRQQLETVEPSKSISAIDNLSENGKMQLKTALNKNETPTTKGLSPLTSEPAEIGRLGAEDYRHHVESDTAGPILTPDPKKRQRTKAGFVRCGCGEQAYDYCARCGNPICTTHGKFVGGKTLCVEGC